MNGSFENAAWPACHSALRLDRWMAGELPREEADALAAHVAGCARCRGAVESIEEDRDRAELPPLRALARPAGARARGWLWPAALGAGAAAAAMSLALLAPRVLDRSPERLKGSYAAVGMYVQHGGEVRRAGPGERVSPGDAVRFVLSLRAPAYVAIMTLDPVGRASVYFPAGDRAEPITAGTDVALPLATRLDDTVGEERVFGFFCDRPLELEPLRAQLPAVASGFVPPGCQVTRWSFEKR